MRDSLSTSGRALNRRASLLSFLFSPALLCGLSDTRQKDFHFLDELAVPATLGDHDSLLERSLGLGVIADLDVSAPEQSPSGRIVRVELDGNSDVLEGFVVLASRR